jgi:HSP20 family protein
VRDLSWRRRERRTIFDEFEELRKEIDEMFEQLSMEQPMWDVTERALEPLAEIHEHRDTVVVMFDLPLVRKEDINLEVDEHSVFLKAELREGVRYRRWGAQQKDCEFGCLQKHLRLPVDVDPNKTKATFRRGVLKLELAKKSEPQDTE